MKVSKIQLAEFSRNVFAVSVPAGVSTETLSTPENWMHVAAKLAKGDHIEVYPEDGAYFAEFIVVAASKNWAKVVLAREVNLAFTHVDKGPDEMYVQWGTPTTGFRVHRRSDKQVVKADFATKELAEIWVTKYKEGVNGVIL